MLKDGTYLSKTWLRFLPQTFARDLYSSRDEILEWDELYNFKFFYQRNTKRGINLLGWVWGATMLGSWIVSLAILGHIWGYLRHIVVVIFWWLNNIIWLKVPPLQNFELFYFYILNYSISPIGNILEYIFWILDNFAIKLGQLTNLKKATQTFRAYI